MAQTRIPVDLFNPGQVFACLGLMELAEVLCGEAQGAFSWQSGEIEQFILMANGSVNPIQIAVDFLNDESTEVQWLSPSDSLSERDGGHTVVQQNISASKSPKAADLPGQLIRQSDGRMDCISFGYWADGSSCFNTTFKKSTNGISSHIRFRNALAGIRGLEREHLIVDPFNQAARTESLFRLDPRGVADPIHTGTSLDILRKGYKGKIDFRVATYPLCETLAVIGLEHARPKKLYDQASPAFKYQVWNATSGLLPIELARVAVASELPFVKTRGFVVFHAEVKKGGDRKMTKIVEVNNE